MNKHEMYNHLSLMHYALRLAERQLGQVWPNPAVGCVIVQDGEIVGIGNTQPGGRPHAETQALAMAGERARGSTLYVSLEPCNHHGQTPPCTEAIIEAGISRVLIACADPDPRVAGSGMAALQAADIEVRIGLAEEAARALNEGFFRRITQQRPLVTVKLATSADGKMAYDKQSPPFIAEEGPRWITAAHARAYSHLLRARHDAILTGIGTVLADDPLLTCRLPGLAHRSPVRVVLDRQGRLPAESRLMHSREIAPLWPMDASAGELPAVLTELAGRGITRLLVEAGPSLTTAFLASGLVDWVYWFEAPLVIGDGGLRAFTIAVPAFPKPQRRFSLGVDRCSVYRMNSFPLNG